MSACVYIVFQKKDYFLLVISVSSLNSMFTLFSPLPYMSLATLLELTRIVFRGLASRFTPWCPMQCSVTHF